MVDGDGIEEKGLNSDLLLILLLCGLLRFFQLFLTSKDDVLEPSGAFDVFA